MALQDVGSKAEISLDGKALEKNKEYKISVGQELKIGDDAVYQVRHPLQKPCCRQAIFGQAEPEIPLPTSFWPYHEGAEEIQDEVIKL